MTRTKNYEMNKIKEKEARKVTENLEDFIPMYAQSIRTGQVTVDRRAEVYWQVTSYRGA